MNTQFTKVGRSYVRCDLKSYNPKKPRTLSFDPLAVSREALMPEEEYGERIPDSALLRVPPGSWVLALWEGCELGTFVHLLYHRLPSRKKTPAWELWRCENGLWEICDERLVTSPLMAERSWWVLNIND